MGVRHSGREIAIQALYLLDLREGASNDDLLLFFEAFAADEHARRFALQLVDGVRGARAALDREIAADLEHWSIGRLSRVDHNILRLALYELLHLPDVPARVTIDEAIELAKTYGDRDSGRFVNGVLDHLAGRLKLKGKGEDGPPAKANTPA